MKISARVMKKVAIVVALVAVASPAMGKKKEGFGKLAKATAYLERTSPPEVYIPGERIAVRCEGYDRAFAHRIQGVLESELLGSEPRFKLSTDHPETLIEVKVLEESINRKWEVKEVYDLFKGEKVKARFLVINQITSVSYTVRDTRTDDTLDADTVDGRFSKEYREGEGAPDDATLTSNAVTYVVNQIVPRLAPTAERFSVLLPKGRLAPNIALAKAGNWTAYLNAVEKLPESSIPQDESYRQYAIGLAYEAIGYQADDLETTLKYLEEASFHYNRALSSNPGEKFFSKAYNRNGVAAMVVGEKKAAAPIARINIALEQYQTLLEFSRTAEEGAKKADGSSGMSDLTNDSVIQMTKAGLPPDVVLKAIDDAQDTRFDVSPNGLINLAQAKVGERIIRRMQERSED